MTQDPTDNSRPENASRTRALPPRTEVISVREVRDRLQQGQRIMRLSLPGADLAELQFPQADLQGSDLTDARLSFANFQAADLSRSTLHGADLAHAELNGALLSAADLTCARLEHADFRDAILNRARLCRVTAHTINLDGAGLTGAELTGAYAVEASARDAVFTSATMDGANFHGADLTGARLDGAGLRGVTLDHATLRGANLSHADLRGATLDQADLTGADLRWARLDGAHLHEAILQDTNLRGARGLVLDETSVRNVRLDRGLGRRWRGLRAWWEIVRILSLTLSAGRRRIPEWMRDALQAAPDLRRRWQAWRRQEGDDAQATKACDDTDGVPDATPADAETTGDPELASMVAGTEILDAHNPADAATAPRQPRHSRTRLATAMTPTERINHPARQRMRQGLTRALLDVGDLWFGLKRTYTGPKLVLNLVLLLTFVLPYFGELLFWQGVGKTESWVLDAVDTMAIPSPGSVPQTLPEETEPPEETAPTGLPDEDASGLPRSPGVVEEIPPEFLEQFPWLREERWRGNLPRGWEWELARDRMALTQTRPGADGVLPNEEDLRRAWLARQLELRESAYRAAAGVTDRIRTELRHQRQSGVDVPVWYLVLGFDNGLWPGLFTLMIVLYVLMRTSLTVYVSHLRDLEKESGFSPALVEYAWLKAPHLITTMLMVVASVGYFYNMLVLLGTTVWVPAFAL